LFHGFITVVIIVLQGKDIQVDIEQSEKVNLYKFKHKYSKTLLEFQNIRENIFDD